MWDINKLQTPRESAREALKEAVGKEAFESNMRFVNELRNKISNHQLSKNETRNIMLSGQFSLNAIKKIHLEYRHAGVQPFTDALCAAQFRSYQLEEKGIISPGDKLIPRFLLNLNCLDEFGFTSGKSQSDYYLGHPEYAHYPLFEKVLTELGLNNESISSFVPSPVSENARRILKSTFDRFEDVVTLLAVGEIEVILFSNPLKINTIESGVDVSSGYYQVHGTEALGEKDAHDDDHEDDCWIMLAASICDKDYSRIETLAFNYLNAWDDFWNDMKERYLNT